MKKLFMLFAVAILAVSIFILPAYGGELRADLNGDGKVDSDDAVYLLYHVYFPEQYPVHEIADPDHDCGTPTPGGKICVTCGQSLPAEHEHTVVTDPAVKPTCTEDGITEGKHCSVCGEVITAQVTVPATGHTEVIDKAIEPTCTESGKTEGKHCSVCNVTIVAQTTVAVKEHTFISGYSVNATCKDEGKIVGSMCSSCGFEQEITYIAPTGHTIINNSCSQCNASKYMKIFEWFLDFNGNGMIDIGDEFVWPYYDLKNLEVFENLSDKLDTIIFPEKSPALNDYKYTFVAEDSFFDYPSTNIVLQSNIQKIYTWAFRNCVNLTTIQLTSSVNYIGASAFYNCTSLKYILFDGTVEQWNSIEKEPLWDENTGDYTIICNDGSISSSEGKPTIEMEIEHYGNVVFELYPDVAPITVANFISLASEGFYDNNNFHRLVKGSFIQGGDPTATGNGGSGKPIKGEFSRNGIKNNLKHTAGVISMVHNSDPDSASSQFFIVLETNPFFDGNYAAFGKIIEGFENIKAIEKAQPDSDKLENPIKIIKTTVNLNGYKLDN